MKLGDVSIGIIQLLLDTVHKAGKDSSPLLEKYGLSQAFLGNGHSQISLSKLMYIGHDAIQLIEKTSLGLLMGQNVHPGNIGLSGWAAMTAPDLSRALSTYFSYELLETRNVRGRSRYYQDAGTRCPIYHFYSIAPYNHFNYFCVDYALCHVYQIAHMITESSDLLHHVDIEYEDIGDRDLFEQYFKCPVNYGADRNALVFQPQAGDLPSRFSSPVHHHLAKELADRELAALSGHRNLSERVIKELTPLLTSEPPTIDELAEKMGMTSWTLRRRLKKENTSFQELLDNTRKDLAICYVADTIHSFSEITYILGFSSTSAFYKAFKRWTGENPGDYRKSEDHSRDR